MTRPSTRWAVIVSSVTSTRSIRDSTLTTVLVPCLDNRQFVLHNETTDLVEFSWAEPMIPREFDGRQPELRVLPFSVNVDVDGLDARRARGSALDRSPHVFIGSLLGEHPDAAVCGVNRTRAETRLPALHWPATADGTKGAQPTR